MYTNQHRVRGGHSPPPTLLTATGTVRSQVPTFATRHTSPPPLATSPRSSFTKLERSRFRNSFTNVNNMAPEGEKDILLTSPSKAMSSALASSSAASMSKGDDMLNVSASPTSKEHKVSTSNAQTGVNSGASSAAAAVPFWTIAAIVTIVFLCHGWIAEMLVIAVVNNGYSLGWFFAFLTVLGQWLPTIPKRGWSKSEFRVEHAIVGVAHCVSLGMSNSGGMLVEYNTYSLFKSSKVVFVMMVSWVLLGLQPSTHEMFWGFGLMVGLLMLTGADETYRPESHRITSPITGAALLFTGISGNALVSVGQQAALQRRTLQKNPNLRSGSGLLSLQCPYTWGPQNSLPPPPGTTLPSKDDEREALLFYSNIISITLLGGVCLANGELLQGLKFFTETATFSMWVGQVTAMALVAFGQRLVLTLNGAHGATASAAVLTFRKVASFITSVLVFPKPFHPFHAIGLFVVVASAVMIQRAESLSATQRKLKDETSKLNKVQDSV